MYGDRQTLGLEPQEKFLRITNNRSILDNEIPQSLPPSPPMQYPPPPQLHTHTHTLSLPPSLLEISPATATWQGFHVTYHDLGLDVAVQ